MKKRRVRAFGLALAALGALAFATIDRWAPPGATGAWMGAAGLAPRTFAVDGLQVRYVRAGEGPRVLLIHGLASSLYTWKDVLPVLAAEHEVVALDLPPFGGSQVPPTPGAALYVRVVEGLFDHLGWEKASLVGNSLGGAVASAFASERPARVEKLVLVDSAGFNFAAVDRPWILRVAGSEALAPVADVLPVRPMVTLALRQVFADDSLVTAEKTDEYIAPLLRPGVTRAIQKLLSGRDAFGFPDRLSRVAAPTLVIWGDQDTWIPLEHADRFLKAVAGSRKVVLSGCGHMPQEERPVETARLLEEFLPGEPRSGR